MDPKLAGLLLIIAVVLAGLAQLAPKVGMYLAIVSVILAGVVLVNDLVAW